MRTAIIRRVRPLRRRGWRCQRFLGNVDDRTLECGGIGLLSHHGVVLDSHRRDPAAFHPAGRRRHRHGHTLRPQCRLLTEIGSQHRLKIGPQCREFGPECAHLVGCLGPQFSGQLPTQMSLHGEFVFAARRYLPVQLQVVNKLHIARPSLIEFTLAAVAH